MKLNSIRQVARLRAVFAFIGAFGLGLMVLGLRESPDLHIVVAAGIWFYGLVIAASFWM